MKLLQCFYFLIFIPVLSVPSTSGHAWKLSIIRWSSVQLFIFETGFLHSPWPRLYVKAYGPIKQQQRKMSSKKREIYKMFIYICMRWMLIWDKFMAWCSISRLKNLIKIAIQFLPFRATFSSEHPAFFICCQ